MTTVFILMFILLSLAIVYFTPRLIYWTITLLIYLALVKFTVLNSINHGAYYFMLVVYVAIAIIFNLRPLRQALITKMVFKRARQVLPKISETEKLALDAGDAWFEKEIFQGCPDFNKLHASKPFQLSAEEQSFLRTETEQLCSMLNDWQINHVERDLPVAVWQFLREKGFFGLVIDKKYGGKGFSAAAHSEIVLRVATRSNVAAVTVMVPNSLGPGELLQHYGTEEQKSHYLPRLAKGQDIPCFALTGPTAGSDATSMPDEGIVCHGEFNGKKILGIKLRNINKRYITLAPIATLVGLAFRLKDPNELLAGVGREGITCALLPHNHPNLQIGERSCPLSQVFVNGPIKMEEGFIPIDWIIGGQQMAGEGWRMLVDCLSVGRSISLPACGTANSLLFTVVTSAYAAIREQFKVAIGTFEGIEEVLARMGGLTYLTNATRQFTVSAVDNGVKPSVASAIAKYHLTENGRKVLIDAMDIHGGRGVIMGPKNYLGQSFQGIPIGITVEGANIMTRNLMIFGQGAMRCHPYVRAEYEALSVEDNGRALADFDHVAFAHVGYFLHNRVRSVFHALTAGIFAGGYGASKFNNYYKKIARLSSAFASVNDLALIVLGGSLKRKERISARLGDAMSYLYMASACLRYFKDNGEKAAEEIFLLWSLQYCLYNAELAIRGVLDNFPLPILAKLVKYSIFPYGRTFKKPSDKLDHAISFSLLSNSEMREVFKKYCYIPDDAADVIGKVEVAYVASLEAAPIKLKIKQAIKKKQLPKLAIDKVVDKALELGIIDQTEVEKLKLAAKYADAAIQVDYFAPYALGPKNAHPDWQNT